LVKFLLNHNAHLDVRDKHGQTPLHLARLCTKNRTEVLKLLLEKYDRTEIDRRNVNGKTALHLAILSNDLDAVRHLLQAGANPAKRTSGWDNAIDLAKRLKQGEKIFDLLKTRGQSKKMPRSSGAFFIRVSGHPKWQT
ncbi:MAG: ankyrin repeat domain-containing protein, partial [Oxalobacteraceae bacterium]